MSNIFNHTESRTFLRQYISELPRKGRGEGVRIAKHLGISTTLVSQVLAGDKSFTTEQVIKLSEHLRLKGLEADYLLFLIQHERAGNEATRRFWKGKLAEIRSQSLKLSNRLRAERSLSDQERSIFYSNPLYSAVRLYASVGKEGKSLAEICERFEIKRAYASEILKFLVETGLCLEHKERLFLGPQSTHLEQGSHHLLRHHNNWRLRAIHHHDKLAEGELMYTAPVSLSRADFATLREEMVDFIKKFLAKVHASEAEEIACFNLDFFWVDR